jgi:hypothetical protein
VLEIACPTRAADRRLGARRAPLVCRGARPGRTLHAQRLLPRLGRCGRSLPRETCSPAGQLCALPPHAGRFAPGATCFFREPTPCARRNLRNGFGWKGTNDWPDIKMVSLPRDERFARYGHVWAIAHAARRPRIERGAPLSRTLPAPATHVLLH